jgi:predicted RNA-binding Zn-ribbon protein involved in translation (DUF1610 family)
MRKYLNKEKAQLDFACPVCGCNKFERTNRNMFEKSLFYLSGGNKATKKYECTNCGWTVLLSADKTATR